MILKRHLDSYVRRRELSENKFNGRASYELDSSESCPMVSFVNLISGKWAIPILYRLIAFDSPVRFSELQRAVAPLRRRN